jgi:hypothetical protein
MNLDIHVNLPLPAVGLPLDCPLLTQLAELLDDAAE